MGLAHKSGANNTYTYFFHVFISKAQVGDVINIFSITGYRCCYCGTGRQLLQQQ